MKVLRVIVTAAVCALFGCSSAEDPNGPPPGPDATIGSIPATVDGGATPDAPVVVDAAPAEVDAGLGQGVCEPACASDECCAPILNMCQPDDSPLCGLPL